MGCETEKHIKELEQLKKDLVKDPNNVDLLMKIGMLLFDPFIDMKAGRLYFDKAIRLDPKNPDLPFWKGYALYHDECAYKESRELFERALSLDQNRAEFHYMMFYALWETENDIKTGLRHLSKAIELQPHWFFPREQYITYLIMENKLDDAELELRNTYVLLEKEYKNKIIISANILEQYYIKHSSKNETTYSIFKRSLDSMKKEIKDARLVRK